MTVRNFRSRPAKIVRHEQIHGHRSAGQTHISPNGRLGRAVACRIIQNEAGQSPVVTLQVADVEKNGFVDFNKFKRDLKSPEVAQRIAGDTTQASKLGVTGTPAFFINGRFLSGAQPFPSFKRVIDEELAEN